MSHQEHFFLGYMPTVFTSPKSPVIGLSRYWHKSPTCDKLKHQKKVLGSTFCSESIYIAWMTMGKVSLPRNHNLSLTDVHLFRASLADKLQVGGMPSDGTDPSDTCYGFHKE